MSENRYPLRFEKLCLAVRIDHVGSKSVFGLDAKPIIEIQISVLKFDDMSSYKTKIEKIGFVLREENLDKLRSTFGKYQGLEELIFM